MKALQQNSRTNRHPDWHEVYLAVSEESLPWHSRQLDPDIKCWIKTQGIDQGDVIDVGCGTGQQAIELAKLGFRVTGIDFSRSAVAAAIRLLPSGSKNPVFRVADALELDEDSKYDLAIDRGCFHVLPEDQRHRYAASLSSCLRPHGVLLLKAFSTLEPERSFGPFRFDERSLRGYFETAFDLIWCNPTSFDGPNPYKPASLFCVFKRKV